MSSSRNSKKNTQSASEPDIAQSSLSSEQSTARDLERKDHGITIANIEDAEAERAIVTSNKRSATCSNNVNNNNYVEPENLKKRARSSEVVQINPLYREKLVRSRDYMKLYQDKGYVTLREIRYQNDLMPHITQPANEYTSENKVPPGERTGIQLLVKDNKIYMVTTRNMQMAQQLPNPKMVTSATNLDIHPKLFKHAFVIVKKINYEGYPVYELRVAASGHSDLINEREGEAKAIVCAGEIYTLDDQLVFANDQTGHFYELLQDYKKEYMTIFEMFFPKELGYTFFAVPNGMYTNELSVIMANQIIDALVLKQIPVAENIITKYRHELAKYPANAVDEIKSNLGKAEIAVTSASDNYVNATKKPESDIPKTSECKATMFSPPTANTERPSTETDFANDATKSKEFDL